MHLRRRVCRCVTVLVLTLLMAVSSSLAQAPDDGRHSQHHGSMASDQEAVTQGGQLLAQSYVMNYDMTNIVLPDYASGLPGYARHQVNIRNAPQGTRVSRLHLSERIEHTYPGDLVVTLSNDHGTEVLLWDRQGAANDGGFDDDIDSDADVTFTTHWVQDAFDGDLVNQSWYLNAWDHAEGHTGMMESFDIWLYYACGGFPGVWINSYGPGAGGWLDQDTYPRLLGDVNGDDLADLVGFGNRATYVSLSSAHGFLSPMPWINCYGPAAGGWASQSLYPRCLGDVNGDGRDDIVGFGSRAVYVSLSTGHSFQAPVPWLYAYSAASGGWTDQDIFPRLLGDVNGDGLADVVGCGQKATYVSLSTGSGFEQPVPWITNFAVAAGGWSSQQEYPRCLGDVNGDGLDDLVGFGTHQVYVSHSTGSGFAAPVPWITAYGVSSGGWLSQDLYPRMLGDMDGDGRADIVGFGDHGTYLSHSLDDGFGAPWVWVAQFGVSAGAWASQSLYPRMVGDVNGDGLADIVGCGSRATYVSISG